MSPSNGARVRRLGFSLLTVLLLGGLLELSARLAFMPGDLVMNPVLSGFEDHPTRLWRYRPSSTFAHHDNPAFVINSLGLRDAEVETPKPDGLVRIVFVGESSTVGAGVLAEESYPEVAGRLLTERGYRVDVVNAATEAYTSWQSRVLVDELGEQLQPDLLLTAHQLNDFLPTGVVDQANYLHRVSGPDRSLMARRRPFAPFLSLLYRSRAYLLLRRTVLSLPTTLPDIRQARDAGTVGQRVPTDDRIAAYSGMKESCEELGCELVILRPIYGRGRGKPQDQTLQEQAARLSAPFLDLAGPRKRSRLKDPVFFQDGVHPTAKGHAVLGEAIADFLVEQGLVGDRG